MRAWESLGSRMPGYVFASAFRKLKKFSNQRAYGGVFEVADRSEGRCGKKKLTQPGVWGKGRPLGSCGEKKKSPARNAGERCVLLVEGVEMKGG